MSPQKYQAPKGTKDHLFESFYRRRQVTEAMLAVTERYGFRQIQTPVIEYFDMLAAKAGPDVAAQIYDFEDKGGRRLGLRFEHTASIARVVAGEGGNLAKPIKIASSGTVYRYERPQSGRQREFTQINVETYGADGTLADAETIACFVDCYRAIGLDDFEVRISDRRLLDAILRAWDAADVEEAIRTIDKCDKLPADKWREAMVGAGLLAARVDDLERFLSGASLAELGLAEVAAPIVAELDERMEHLRLLGAADRCRLDYSIARGLAYYTGCVFECAPRAVSGFGAVGGGGRYDGLIELYGGPPTPAIGFAVGVERVMLLLETLDRLPPAAPAPRGFLVAWYDESCREMALAALRVLRAAGHAAQTALTKQSFKKQFQQANQVGARWAVAIGPDEVAAGRVVLKDLAAREERALSLEELEAFARENAPAG